jgi:hypothetical protein
MLEWGDQFYAPVVGQAERLLEETRSRLTQHLHQVVTNTAIRAAGDRTPEGQANLWTVQLLEEVTLLEHAAWRRLLHDVGVLLAEQHARELAQLLHLRLREQEYLTDLVVDAVGHQRYEEGDEWALLLGEHWRDYLRTLEEAERAEQADWEPEASPPPEKPAHGAGPAD